MDEYRKRLKNFDDLIRKQYNLKKLTEHDAWKDLMKILAEMRVDAMDLAVMEGDTTDAKAYARALGSIINQFYALSNENQMEDLISRKEQLKNEIDVVEKERIQNNNLNYGLSATI